MSSVLGSPDAAGWLTEASFMPDRFHFGPSNLPRGERAGNAQAPPSRDLGGSGSPLLLKAG
jgi:hypothetical protein